VDVDLVSQKDVESDVEKELRKFLPGDAEEAVTLDIQKN